MDVLGYFFSEEVTDTEEKSENADQHLLKQFSNSLKESLGSQVTDAMFRRVWAQRSPTEAPWLLLSAQTHKASLHTLENLPTTQSAIDLLGMSISMFTAPED